MSVEIYPGPRLEMYCCACYEFLWVDAVRHLPELPLIVKLDSASLQFQVPEYLIKDNSFLQLFFPKDAISLGALQQRRRRERGPFEKEGAR